MPLVSGSPVTVDIDVDALTNDFYVDFTASPPDPFTNFFFGMGSFINVFAFSIQAGGEIQIDESIDGSGTTPNWDNAYKQTITPGVLSKVNGYRVNQSFARVSFVNGNSSGTIFLREVGIKLVTM